MDIKEYQSFTPTTWVGSEQGSDIDHAAFGMLSEAGEVAAVYQKYYRGDFGHDVKYDRLRKELGGLMYYVAQLCNLEGISLSEVIGMNKDILVSRKARGVIKGDGDDR